MTAFTGDIQILLYTEEENFSVCRDFYQTLLGQEPYYSWDEGTQDRGAKFRAGRGTISVLCQAHDRKTGPVIVNLETEDVDQTYQELTAAEGIRIVSKPVTQSYGTLPLKTPVETGSTCITAITEFRRSCGSADT